MRNQLITPFSILFYLITASFFAQNVKVKIDKTDYKIDEVIKLTYITDVKIDSVKNIHFTNFTFQKKPTAFIGYSFENGKRITQHTNIYYLKANKSGNLDIKSPEFFFKGKILRCKNLTINVLDKKLLKKEIKAINFNDFKENPIKPSGTYRYVVNADEGYIEVFNNNKWHFLRKLKKEETKLLNTIK